MRSYVLAAFVFLLVAVGSAFANDGVFYAQGNNLIPMQETRVELRKEILKFFVRDFDFMDVDVDFEFFNPDDDRILIVGFVSPPVFGDVEEEGTGHPRITNFTVVVNGETLDYKIAQMKDTSFNSEALDIAGWDYVYYFPVTFKKGMNRIRHTYRFQGGASVETQRDFAYQITTGKRWANMQIDDFELQMHLDEGIYYIPARFVKGQGLANWQIFGDGVLKKGADKKFDFDEDSIRFVHLNSGYLSLREKNFRPDFDIMIGEFNWAVGWLGKMCRSKRKCVGEDDAERIGHYLSLSPGDYIETGQLKELTKTELRQVRNYGFALRGYDFKSPDLNKFYSKFFWYKPNPAVIAEDIELSDAEKTFIEKVRAAEQSKEK